MAHADIADLILALAQGLDDGINSVADDAERVGGAPGDQGLDDDVGGVRVVREARSGLRLQIRAIFAGLRRGRGGGAERAGRRR